MLNVNGGNSAVIGSGKRREKADVLFDSISPSSEMSNDESEEFEERSYTAIDQVTPAASRAQSNYSTYRTKLSIAPARWGETRVHYLWRLLRCSIRRTIDAVARADDTGECAGHRRANLRATFRRRAIARTALHPEYEP